MTKRSIAIYLTAIGLLFAGILAVYVAAFLTQPGPVTVKFDGQRALADVQTQVAFGPRTPGSEAQARVLEWMRSELAEAGWQSEVQETVRMGHPIRNLIAYRSSAAPQIILGAHYDSRLYADRDPDPARRGEPVPGANDGASGVAVLLELARTLPPDSAPIWLAFFDAEDNGGIEGWDWILGSRAFVEQSGVRPQAVIVVDMIGDADLNIYAEKNSDPELTASIWATAAELGYAEAFISEQKYSMLDDHTPFLEAGIPAVDIIDFDYPYWHTTADTLDKVAVESLQAVGETLWTWITQQNRQP